jgi:hypothetical protein
VAVGWKRQHIASVNIAPKLPVSWCLLRCLLRHQHVDDARFRLLWRTSAVVFMVLPLASVKVTSPTLARGGQGRALHGERCSLPKFPTGVGSINAAASHIAGNHVVRQHAGKAFISGFSKPSTALAGSLANASPVGANIGERTCTWWSRHQSRGANRGHER